MADDTKMGTDWSDDELDAIVEDYFVMLSADISGQPYVKSHHSAALMDAIGRTHRSVEFKHQNISAVLDELGIPWIPGYKPKRNYQGAIFDAVDRYLTRHPGAIEKGFVRVVAPEPAADVFVSAPTRKADEPHMPDRLRRLVRKFDPVVRDFRNRTLGTAGEEFVLNVEKRRLAAEGRLDLAKTVEWVAKEKGDGAGYDILSFDVSGRKRLIEVKTTNGSARTPFFLTRNERDLSQERSVDWRLYRVHSFATAPRIFELHAPLENAVSLVPETWRAFVG